MLESLTLFLGALGDALIGPNLFVTGEPFMVAAGYQLYAGSVLGVLAVFTGAFLGDQASFAIGRKYGRHVQSAIIKRRPGLRRKVARGRLMLKTNERKVLVLARLLGPVAWVVPFIAGSGGTRWQRFTVYSSIGLLLGVGQFVFWGYLLAMGIESIPWFEEVKIFVSEHMLLMITIGSVVLFYLMARRYKKSRVALKSIALLLIGILLLNYTLFFEQSDDGVSTEQVVLIDDLTLQDYKVYAGRSAYFKAQAMNVVYIGDSPREMMLGLGWIENKTFSRNDISFMDYIRLLKSKTPPVSDLYWQGIPQEMAFQLPGTLSKRNHIRWWSATSHEQGVEKQVWFGAISYDDGLGIALHSGLITLLHTVEADVDKQRDFLARTVIESDMWHGELQSMTKPAVLDDNHDYYTDGQVLVVRPTMSLAAEI